jgi:tRNA pseudouridine13 synthase
MNQNTALPYLTADLPGTGGQYKAVPEDFFVEELPAYSPSGQGSHVYALIEKKGISTWDAVLKIASAMGIRRKDVGFAGMKDARAVSRQWISIEHVDPGRLELLAIPNITICSLARHGNKIKMGHLAGNRFIIRLRELPNSAESLPRAQAVLAVLERRGVPNYFGPQRFGSRADSHELGFELLKGRIEPFMDPFLGNPKSGDSPKVAQARQYYDEGRYQEALDSWPYPMRDHRRALQAMIKAKGDKKKAFYKIDKFLKRFLISSYQSFVFNAALAARLPMLDQLLDGDMAWKHQNGACFRVEDAAREQPRCDAFEISPTGPIIGHRMTELTGKAGEIEKPVLDQAGLTEQDFESLGRLHIRGSRRPLRFQPREISVQTGSDSRGDYLELAFILSSGCYATTLLREIMKAPEEPL